MRPPPAVGTVVVGGSQETHSGNWLDFFISFIFLKDFLNVCACLECARRERGLNVLRFALLGVESLHVSSVADLQTLTRFGSGRIRNSSTLKLMRKIWLGKIFCCCFFFGGQFKNLQWGKPLDSGSSLRD